MVLRYNREKRQNKTGKIYIDSIFLYITMKKEVLLNIWRKEEDMAIFPVNQNIQVNREI